MQKCHLQKEEPHYNQGEVAVNVQPGLDGAACTDYLKPNCHVTSSSSQLCFLQ